jgi:hypothetical protein
MTGTPPCRGEGLCRKERYRVRSTPNAAAIEPAQRRSPARQSMPVCQDTHAPPPSCTFAASTGLACCS